ncbi:hypothetical protein EV361DRAFT_807217, partial [Lentinula raphanica]
SQAHLASKIEELERRLGAQMAIKGSKSNKESSAANCGRKGHIKEECFRKGGGKEGQFPLWWRGKKESTSSLANLAITDVPQHYAMMASQPQQFGFVFVDSAASDHFFWSRSDFITYEPYESVGQSSEENTSFEIVGRGRAKKVLFEGNKEIILTFENALHAPNSCPT